MRRDAEILRLDIVLLGDFNPKIFSPAWFSAYDLIGEIESEEANLEVIHKDVAVFSLDWLRLQVTRDRFSIFTEQEAYFDKLIDLVINTFTYLQHTPINAIGLNWGGHYKAESQKEWHNFGHFLAPQKPWANIFEDSAVLRIEMMEKNPTENYSSGALQVRVEPSKKINQGIFVNINDHYAMKDNKPAIGCSEIISIFKSNKEKSKNKFKDVINHLFDNFDERAE